MALYLWRASANSYANREWKFFIRCSLKKENKIPETNVKSTLLLSIAVTEKLRHGLESMLTYDKSLFLQP